MTGGGIPVPRTPFDVRRQIATEDRELGYRAVQLLEFVRRHMTEHGRPPSYAIIRDELGFYDSGDVGKCVRRLENRGLVYREKLARTGRGIQGAILRLC